MKSRLVGSLCVGLVMALVIGGAAWAGTTIKIAYPGWDSKDQEKEVTGIFADYEKKNPGVKIELISIPFPVMKQKLVVALRSGDAPDVGYVDGRWLQEMQAAGFLGELDDVVKDIGKADFYEAPWKSATVAGKVYAIPDRIDPWMIYYNTEMFKKAGVAEFPKTMDDFVRDAKKLTGQGQYGYGLIGANDATFIGRFLNFLYAFHGNLLKADGKTAAINDEAGVATFQFYGDLLLKHKVVQPSAIGNSHNDVRQLFMTQQVAMMIDGPWARGTLKEMAPSVKWSVGQIPRVGNQKPRFTMSSWYYVTFAPSTVRQESKKFVKFLLQPENMARSVVTIPGRKSAAVMARFQTPDWKPWIEAAPHGEPLPITDKFSEIADIVGNASQQVLSQKKQAKEAADEAAARMNKLFQ
jgi:multiple sugar transport system substrate-binding protein